MRARSCALVFAAVLAAACERPEPVRVDAPAPVAPLAEPVAATLTVRAEAPGLNALDVERDVTMPLETALVDVPGVAGVRSVSRADRARVVLTLAPGHDSDEVRRAVHERLTGPRGVRPLDAVPAIEAELAPRAHARHFVVTGDLDAVGLRAVAQRIADDLRMAPGVARIELCGGREPLLRISLDPERLAAYGLTVAPITRALGEVLGADRLAPAPPRKPGIEDLHAQVIKPGEAAVRLGDVASIAVDSSAPGCEAAQVGGGPVIVGTVIALARAAPDPLAVALADRLAAAQSSLPAGVRLTAPPLVRVALATTAAAAPEQTVPTMARAIGEALARGPAPPRGAYVQASAPDRAGAPVELELLIDRQDADGLATTLGDVPGLRIRALGGDVEAIARAVVCGDELATAARLAEELATIVRGVPAVADVLVRHASVPAIEIELHRDRLAGLAQDELRATLGAALGGVAVGSFAQGSAVMPARVSFAGPSPATPEARLAQLAGIRVPTPTGAVALADLVRVEAGERPHTLTRVDGRRAVEVELRFADPEAPPGEALQRAVAAGLRLPPGYTVHFESLPRSAAAADEPRRVDGGGRS